jgi:hypothetical protein
MNEIVKPNAAMAEAATLIDLRSNLSNVARDVDMLQVFLDAKSRHSAENFLSKVRYADGYSVICQKLPRGKAKMYKIVNADQVAA